MKLSLRRTLVHRNSIELLLKRRLKRNIGFQKSQNSLNLTKNPLKKKSGFFVKALSFGEGLGEV